MKTFVFSRDYRLNKRSDFLNLRVNSYLIKGKYLWLYYKKKAKNYTEKDKLVCDGGKIAFSISRSTGNAVLRNNIKRQLREYYRTSRFKNLSFLGLLVCKTKKNAIDWPTDKKEFLQDVEGLFLKLEKKF